MINEKINSHRRNGSIIIIKFIFKIFDSLLSLKYLSWTQQKINKKIIKKSSKIIIFNLFFFIKTSKLNVK